MESIFQSKRTYVSILYLLLTSIIAQGQQWPINQADDVANWNRISGTFGEIHPTSGDHFHAAIDIDISTVDCPARATMDGRIHFNGTTSTIVEHNYPAGTNQHNRRSRYIHLDPSLSLNTTVDPGEEVGVIENSSPTNGNHLHFEMWQYDSQAGEWAKHNPLRNNIGWTIPNPADAANPQINDIIIRPFQQQNNAASGLNITSATNAISSYQQTMAKIHIQDRPGSTGSVYNEDNDKLFIYGNIVPIISVRDPNINSTAAGGIGLTIHELAYSIGEEDKFLIEFDQILNVNRREHEQIFQVSFSGTNHTFGNNDFIKMYAEGTNRLRPQKSINNIESNGVWSTRIRAGEEKVFSATPNALSRSNDDAEYPDGEYELSFHTEDASNRDDDDIIQIHVDNFHPFVQTVDMLVDTDPVYFRNWRWDTGTGTYTFEPDFPILGAGLNEEIEVSVTASEAMQWMQLSIPSIGYQQNSTTPEIGSNGKEFKFTIPGHPTEGEYQMHISGEDLAGHMTLTDPSVVPLRNQNGWSPEPISGADTNHILHVLDKNACQNGGGTGCPLIAEFTHSTTFPNNQTVHFTDLSIPSDEIGTWEWEFGDGNTSGEQNPVHDYLDPGEYDVELTIYRSTTESSSYSEKIVVLEDAPGGALEAKFTLSPATGKVPITVKFNSTSSTGTIARRTWEILPDTGFELKSGQTMNNSIIDVTFNNQGEYDITLKVESPNDQEEVTKQFIAQPAEGDFTVDFEYDAPLFSGHEEQFRALISGETGSCSATDFKWTFAKGDFFERTLWGSVVFFNFINPGTYTVELQVFDNCQKAVTRSKNVTIRQSGNNATAKFSGGDGIVRVGQVVKFIDQSTPKDDIKQWAWNFRLPEDFEGPADCPTQGMCPDPFYNEHRAFVEHVFDEPGSYKTRLSVTTDIFYQSDWFDKVITVVPDWGLDVPTQTESFIYTENQDGAFSYPGGQIEINGDYFVGTKLRAIPFVGGLEQDTKLYVYKRHGNEWRPHSELSRGNQDPLLIYSDVSMGENLIAGIANGSLYMFNNNGNDWLSSTPSAVIYASEDFKYLEVDIDEEFAGVFEHNGEFKLHYGFGFDNANIVLPSKPRDMAVSGNTVALSYRSWQGNGRVDVYEYTDALRKVATLTSTFGNAGAESGFGESMDFDGNTIIVGIDLQGVNTDGSAYVYEKPASGWVDNTETARLTAFDGQALGEHHYGFGFKVRISGDIIAVLADKDLNGSGCIGQTYSSPCSQSSIYIYEKTTNGWESSTQHAKLVTSETNVDPFVTSWSEDFFAFSGNTLVVSDDISRATYSGNVLNNSTGKYRVFELEDTYLPICNSTATHDLFLWDISPDSFLQPPLDIRSVGSLILGGSGTTELVPGFFYHPASIASSTGTGSVEFSSSDIQLKPGFRATAGAEVTFKAATCAELIIEASN